VDALTVTDNEQEQRYEVSLGGELAISQYRRSGDEITFLHTEVPKALGGRGVGTALVRAELDDARVKGLTVVPVCPFVRAFIVRHPEYLDIVEARHRRTIEQEIVSAPG
jgi:uncharacterized protein